MINHEVEQLFFANNSNLELKKTTKIIQDSLLNMDEGELFLEYSQSEAIIFDDGRVKTATYDSSKGFGLRGIIADADSYAYSSILTIDELSNAANIVRSLGSNANNKIALNTVSPKIITPLYATDNPVLEGSFASKIELLSEIDQYIRAKSQLIKQVSCSLSGEWQAICIINKDGNISHDIRPLVRLSISVVVEKNGRIEAGSYGTGGRQSYLNYTKNWQNHADEALRQALVNLESIPTPAAEMTVVLGSGWPGVLLHEAVGHGLEGDFNRKGTSAFSKLIGKQVASKGVTVIDDGTIANRRGSLNIDDEGTPTAKNILIEDGILQGYMQDKQNAKLMNVKPTGNGRRENFACTPMPRMTNTFMLAGKDKPSDIISSVKNGLYAVNFGGGQVDITSGKFVFSTSEAYLIENGKITQPVKGATLIGNGPDALTKITAIGNDLQLDAGVGTCGKAGQSVPVGVGQPTLCISNMTVGGTKI
jgi:TldD protein